MYFHFSSKREMAAAVLDTAEADSWIADCNDAKISENC